VVDNLGSLDAMMQFAHQIGFTPTRLDHRQFLHEEAAHLPRLVTINASRILPLIAPRGGQPSNVRMMSE
jgi:hypothetical protein